MAISLVADMLQIDASCSSWPGDFRLADYAFMGPMALGVLVIRGGTQVTRHWTRMGLAEGTAAPHRNSDKTLAGAIFGETARRLAALS